MRETPDDLPQRLRVLIDERRALGEYDANATVVLQTLELLAEVAARLDAVDAKVNSMAGKALATEVAGHNQATWLDSAPAEVQPADWRKRKPCDDRSGTKP